MTRQPDVSPIAEPAPPRRPIWARWRGRLVLAAVLALLGGVGYWHATKPLPPGTRVASPWTQTPASDVRLLIDLTAADAYGRPVVQQQIFDEALLMIREARRFIVLDQFLFNAHRGALDDAAAVQGAAPLRPLSRELRDALIDARRAQPQLRVLLITDPINDVYGGAPSPDLAMLRTAGIDVVVTNLDRLRDANPLYSSVWRVAIDWWSGDGEGPGWLPNPLDAGPSKVTFRAWARLLNLKANHRKVLIADDGGSGIVGMVGSANPHDASSAHSNLALQVRGAALLPLLQSEQELARFSGWRGEPIQPEMPTPSLSSDAAAANTLSVRTLTEGAIRDAIVEQINSSTAGDQIEIAMFYFSERRIINALLAAAARGTAIRLVLDPNRDAFGHEKNGIPNRPVASEIVSRSDGAIKLRWYRTHGEQFHTKLFMLRQPTRVWFTLGSANLTRRNVADFNLEANLAVESAPGTAIAADLERYFETIWQNRAPTGVEYTADFGTFADPAQASYWSYRLMESTGLSSF